MKKIVITNYDVISACGVGREQFGKNILAGNDYSSEITRFDVNTFKSKKAFNVNLDFVEYLGKHGLKHTNRNAKLCYSAIEKLLLPEFAELPENQKPGVVIGTAFGSVESIGSFWKVQLTEGSHGLRPLEFPNTVINAPGSFINIRYGISDVSATISTGFNSSLDAFIYAYDYIQNNHGEKLIVGGAEELGEFLFLGLDKSGMLTKDGTIKPFDKTSNGTIIGEGAAFFMIESLESAQKRNAEIIAELIGFDSFYSKNEDDGVLCFKNALKMANISPDKVELVSSCANGNIENDNKISGIYNKVFGAKFQEVLVKTDKAYFGECYGASGALQTASVLSNFKTNNINYFSVDGFSCEGNNAVLIFKKYAS